MNRKIWKLQDSTKNRFIILIRILFESGADAWRVSIGRYRFRWISDMSHRIKVKSDAPDWSIPVWLSDLFEPQDQDLTVEIRRRGKRVPARVPARNSPARHAGVELRRCSGAFWSTTRFSGVRRPWVRDRGHRSPPVTKKRHGWSSVRCR
jgi:hypothetical protein